jgi:hypothetical protein
MGKLTRQRKFDELLNNTDLFYAFCGLARREYHRDFTWGSASSSFKVSRKSLLVWNTH